ADDVAEQAAESGPLDGLDIDEPVHSHRLESHVQGEGEGTIGCDTDPILVIEGVILTQRCTSDLPPRFSGQAIGLTNEPARSLVGDLDRSGQQVTRTPATGQ